MKVFSTFLLIIFFSIPPPPSCIRVRTCTLPPSRASIAHHQSLVWLQMKLQQRVQSWSRVVSSIMLKIKSYFSFDKMENCLRITSIWNDTNVQSNNGLIVTPIASAVSSPVSAGSGMILMRRAYLRPHLISLKISSYLHKMWMFREISKIS